MTFHSGWHFLQTPGPSNVPERVRAAMARPTIDHRSREFSELTLELIDGLRHVANTAGSVILFPSSGTGAWEAAIVNTLSPGDRVVMYETGHFSTLWYNMAKEWGLDVEFLPGDWRHGVNTSAIEEILNEDRDHSIRAVMLIHNETSTGVKSSISSVRQTINRVDHPALLMVDTISSLASIDYRQDEWGVDVTVGCSQKGLMLPPGLGINIVSDKALQASTASRFPKSYWNWNAIISANQTGYYPYTPPTNLLFGLQESLRMLHEEGMTQVFERHARFAEATRRAVSVWGFELLCTNPNEYSDSLTAVVMPREHDSTDFCHKAAENFNVSLGQGLGKLAGKVFRIGHMGYFNEPMLVGTLGAIELTLRQMNVPIHPGGVNGALDYLSVAYES